MIDKAENKLENYKVDTTMTMAQRAADVLYWASQAIPLRPISYTQLAKIIYQLPRVPRENDGTVKQLRKTVLKNAKRILMDKYGCGLVSHPGFGVRATTDSSDMARTQFSKDRRRAGSSIKALQRSSTLIKVSEITDRDLRARVTETRDALKVFVAHDIVNKLLPEKKDKE